MKKLKELKLMFVVASRPNFMKVAPLAKEAKKQGIKFCIFYTEQHKSELMSEVFFKELGIPKPNFNLGLSEKVKEGSKISKGFGFLFLFKKARNIVKRANPDCVVVVGDVFSSAYIAVVAKSLGIPVAHVEAGLRSFNNKMPEEKARKLIDNISKLLFTTEETANKNLINEGKSRNKIFYVGNIMIDSLYEKLNEAKKIDKYKKLGLKNKNYAIVTFHRHENIENLENLEKFLRILREISKKIKIVFPLHPSTKSSLNKFGLSKELQGIKNLKIIDPQGYKEILNLVMNSKFIMTDSGGLQEESSVLEVPCLTLRSETERPVTVKVGTNTVVGLDLKKILIEVDKILNNRYKKGKTPYLWDGKTSERIIKILSNKIK